MSNGPFAHARTGGEVPLECSAPHPIRFIPLSYSAEDSHASALRIITQLRPDWNQIGSVVSFVRFTDGITNTLLKATRRRELSTKTDGQTDPNADGAAAGPAADETDDDADNDAILLRAYGHGTDVIIDRHRETQNHELLSRYGLAPTLLARFENGMLYRFIRGSVTHPDDLRRPEIYGAVARRLAQWHATVPCLPDKGNGTADEVLQKAIDALPTQGKPTPHVWSVMQKWILALPTETKEQQERQARLQKELYRLASDLSARKGLGENGLVFAHCDLLSGNIIVLPKVDTNGVGAKSKGDYSHAFDESPVSVAFIDYEYATPSPAAFDIANHFAEWGGFDCNYSMLPTRSQRRAFITEYVKTYFDLLPDQLLAGSSPMTEDQLQDEVKTLLDEVDIFRGVPGFYWGIWALIQAKISDIDFDYASYAETRLGEYWAWKAEVDGSRKAAGLPMPLREARWAQEG